MLTNCDDCRYFRLYEQEIPCRICNKEKSKYEKKQVFIKDIFAKANKKIEIKLWSVEYAKGYCSSILNELYDGIIEEEEYNLYSKMIDELG